MLKLIIWDVQHGSAAYIKTPNGKNIVIDLGAGDISAGDVTFSPLQYLYSCGMTTIDHLILTHPHTDHIDDIFNIDLFDVKAILRPGHLSEKDIRDANKEKLKTEKYIEFQKGFTGPIILESDSFRSMNNGGVSINYYVPNKCATSNINNHSVVTILEYLGVKIIIPGDNGPASWNELLELDDFKKAIKGTHVFIASHHGRESGYSDELFKIISPKIVIVSDGKYSDTSITSKYSSAAKGWDVFSRSGAPHTNRKCLTTRTDGTIEIQVYNEKGQNYLDIFTE